MKSIFAVTEYIIKQNFRNKILNVLTIFSIFIVGFSLIISELAQESEIRMLKDFGLFSISMLSFITLLLSVTLQMFEETELKTMHIIMVKPIKRSEYLIGKYLGTIITLFMNILFMLMVLMLVIQIRNSDPWDLNLLLSVFFIFLSLCIISSVAILFSVVTTSVPACILFLFFTYVLGHLTIHLKNLVMNSGNQILKMIVDLIYYVVPNLELFNFKNKLESTYGLIDTPYVSFVLLYSILYVIVILFLSIKYFEKKEFF
ncbi:MAG: ABC transporter permease [Candidatus Goldbacteria bacterium]|nr:ABC transporter permease [Candidatus Goldiibacteriota bacterium]